MRASPSVVSELDKFTGSLVVSNPANSANDSPDLESFRANGSFKLCKGSDGNIITQELSNGDMYGLRETVSSRWPRESLTHGGISQSDDTVAYLVLQEWNSQDVRGRRPRRSRR